MFLGRWRGGRDDSGYIRKGYNPKSLENLRRNQDGVIEPSIKKGVSDISAVADAMVKIEEIAAARERAAGERAKARQAEIEAAVAAMDAGGGEESSLDNMLLSMLPALMQKTQSPAVGNLPSMPPAFGEPTLPTDTAANIDNASKLKMALKLPDAAWTKENVRTVLHPWGLGDLSDKDIKRLGEKLLRAVK